jgi:hypothetical protein
MKRWMTIAALICASNSLTSQPTISHGVLDFPRFRLVEGNLDSDGLPLSGAQLCLLQTPSVCYRMPSHPFSKGDKNLYEFGLHPRAERLVLKQGGSIIFFSGQFSGGGSGTLDRLAVLRYQSRGKLINLLPYIAVTNQSERAMWSLTDVSDYPVLVTADFFWDFDAHETHFAQHFYDVRIYRFDPAKDQYVDVVDYRTTQKYPGLDERESIKVLTPERDEILRRLKLVN